VTGRSDELNSPADHPPPTDPATTVPVASPVRPTRRRALSGLAAAGGLAGVAALAAACDPPRNASGPGAVSPPAPRGSVATGATRSAAGTPAESPGAGGGSPSASTTAGAPGTSGTPTAPVSAPPSGGGAGTSTAAHPAAVTAGDWRALAAGLQGTLVRPGDSGFAAAAPVFNTRFDAVTPAAVVRCAGPADVVAAVGFARRFGLRAVPRAGGHGYLGSGTVGGGLVIDTGPLTGVRWDAASATAAIGAGTRLVDVHQGLDVHGRGLPAGSCPAVGMGGSALGGGLGVVSTAHGLTCDAVRSVDVVTADGRHRTVSATAEPDLFWALRGGGGGTVAIATSFRVDAFRTSDCGLFFASWPWSAAASVVAGWQRRLAVAPDSAWSNLHLDVSPASRSVSVSGVSLTGSATADAAALVAAVGVDPRSVSTQTSTYLHTMLVEAGCSRVGFTACHPSPVGSLQRQGFLAGSSVLARTLPDRGIAALLRAVSAGASAGLAVAAICDPLGGAAGRVPPAATAFPWRRAAASVQWYAGLPTPASPGAVARAQSWVATSRAGLRPWSAGAYVNYPDASVTDPRTYHGDTATRLRGVLRRYDPDGFFDGPGRLAA